MEERIIKFDVLIPAHGESINQIENLLCAVHLQQTPHKKLGQILLCSDNKQIYRHFFHRSDLEFIYQEANRGKPHALNLLMSFSDSPICIQNSADCIPGSEQTYDYLLEPLENSIVGAVTSKPVPFNEGFISLPNIVWRCHEFVQPKLNAELFSFKKDLVGVLPETVIHDDAYIHYLILQKYYQVVYEPKAIVLNKTPESFGDFYEQRRKNVLGNLQLETQFGIKPIRFMRLRSLILMSLELLANVHGRLDYVRGKVPKGLVGYNLESTKEVFS